VAAHILVVDDNEMNRDVLSRRLEKQGYTTALAEDGERALEMLRADSYDMVMLDIMMPRLNGYQVLEAMKADENMNSIPVIVISAVDELDSIVRCVELGAEDYLFKPFNPVLLRARVNASLEKKRLRDSMNAAALREPLAQIVALANAGAGADTMAEIKQIAQTLLDRL
jgi:adenylate cyclase